MHHDKIIDLDKLAAGKDTNFLLKFGDNLVVLAYKADAADAVNLMAACIDDGELQPSWFQQLQIFDINATQAGVAFIHYKPFIINLGTFQEGKERPI